MLELPEEATYGTLYDPAMVIETQEEATEYFEALVQRYIRCFDTTREEAEEAQRHNLDYYAGYCSDGTKRRVKRLFKTAGATPEEAFKARWNRDKGVNDVW